MDDYTNKIALEFRNSIIKKGRLPFSALIFGFLVWSTGIPEKDSQSFVNYSEKIPGSSEQVAMAAIDGGTFLMGSPEQEAGGRADEGPQIMVKVDPFWIAKYEITWNQYDLFANEVIGNLRESIEAASHELGIQADAVSIPTPPYVDLSFGMGRDGFPAVSMTHYAAVMFTKWLTAKTGNFYRLPTEAEWEYTCRAGFKTTIQFAAADLDRFVWHAGNSGNSYNQIGLKEPNNFGIYDMPGNIAEWTMDQYMPDYFERVELNEEGVAENPWFKPSELYPRSVRGGSWMDGVDDQRCAKRRGSSPDWKMLDPQLPKSLWWHTNAQFVGFRVVRPKVTPPREEMERYWIEAMEDYF